MLCSMVANGSKLMPNFLLVIIVEKLGRLHSYLFYTYVTMIFFDMFS